MDFITYSHHSFEGYYSLWEIRGQIHKTSKYPYFVIYKGSQFCLLQQVYMVKKQVYMVKKKNTLFFS